MGLNFGYNGYEQPMVVNTYPPMGYGNFGGNGGLFGGNGGDWMASVRDIMSRTSDERTRDDLRRILERR